VRALRHDGSDLSSTSIKPIKRSSTICRPHPLCTRSRSVTAWARSTCLRALCGPGVEESHHRCARYLAAEKLQLFFRAQSAKFAWVMAHRGSGRPSRQRPIRPRLGNTATGQHSIWILENGVFQYSISLLTVAAPWHLAGVGDFNGDGFADLVWENSVTGARVSWLLIDGVRSSTINHQLFCQCGRSSTTDDSPPELVRIDAPKCHCWSKISVQR
jgi:hypothetical protein